MEFLKAFHLSARKPLEPYHAALQECDAYFVGSEPVVEADRVEALRETVFSTKSLPPLDVESWTITLAYYATAPCF